MAGRFGLDTTTNSRQTPRHHLKEINAQDRDHEKDSQGLFGFTALQREPSKLTNGLGDGHDLRAVKGQVAERPDDRMNLLHDVEGDGHDAARVLSHGHTPARTVKRRSHQNVVFTAAEKLQSSGHLFTKKGLLTDPGHVWLGSNRMSSVGS